MSEITPHARTNLQYVSDMLEQLKVVSAAHSGPFLVHLIDMAKHEAINELQRHHGAASGEKRDPAV